MNRRKFLSTAATLGSAAAFLPNSRAAGPNESAIALKPEKARLVPPRAGSIPVAMVISAGLNVIDFSGPWGVFESVSVPSVNEAFRLFTVAEAAT